MGFPGKKVDVVGKKGTSFTTDDISIVEASVSDDPSTTSYKGTKIIMTNNTVTDGFSGGPLVDENGNVIGIVFAGDYENKCYSVATSEFLNVLNRYGIEYTSASGGTPAEEPEEDNTEEEEPEEEPAEEQAPVTPPEPEKKSIPIWIFAIIAAVIAIVIILVIVLVTKGKKQEKVEPVTTFVDSTPPSIPPSAPVGGSQTAPSVAAYNGGTETGVLNQGSGETTVLGQGSNETTVLSGASARGTLTRNKTGERVSINKEVFKIGRERSRVDYCISDNTAVGRHHATIITRNGESFIVDQNSRNFTFVNDVKSAPNVETKLNNGDKVCLADEEFTFNC
jgi:hypothetical protein